MSKNMYNLESETFLKKADFYKKHLNIDLRSYWRISDDGREEFAQKELFQDTLARVYTAYQKANTALPDIDFQAITEESFDNLVKNVSSFVLDRKQLYKIITAHGDDLKSWMIDNLETVSNGVISLKDKSNLEKIARIFTVEGCVLGITGMCVELCSYASLAALAPVGYELLGGISAFTSLLTAIFNPTVLAAVIIGTTIIATVLAQVAALDRELSCLLINDTDYDILIDDIHMECGYLSAMVNDSTAKERTIPKRKSQNMVYLSFYTITRKAGFYGAESTMHFTIGEQSVYALSANPLSQNTRVGIAFRENITSEKIHAELYNKNVTEDKCIQNNLLVETKVNSRHGEKAYAVTYFSQVLYEYGNFTTEVPCFSYGLSLSGSNHTRYCREKQCLEIEPGGFVCFAACSTWDKGNIFINLRCDASGTTGKLLYTENNDTNIKFLVRNADDFTKYHFSMHGNFNEQYGYIDLFEFKNEGSCNICIRSIEVYPSDREGILTDWMRNLKDDVLLSEINIPGTHDSAAIHSGWIHTMYACHNQSVTKQLNAGIRLLDVRIKIKQGKSGIEFMTCHGNFGGSAGLNEYQSLSSFLDECKDFLRIHSGETIIMSLKIDDDEVKEPETALPELKKLLAQYPVRDGNRKDLGTLKDARGKIILFNRINQDKAFGYPITWDNNTRGSYADISEVKTYVQDYWNVGADFNADENKGKLVIDTMKHKRKGEVVLNYASACKFGVIGVYCIRDLISYFGKNKPESFGWMLFDYENLAYDTNVYGLMNIVSIVVDSNYGYCGSGLQYQLKDKEQGYSDL